jgi:3-phenylpropionate/trans-cinnamate dioxygenase ferredoxin subunit
MVAEFVRVCKESDISDGSVRAYEVDGRSILLSRVDGRIYAIDNVCSHDGGDLGEGELVDGQIECPRHGARFDVKTGEATRMPAVCRVDSFEVKIDKGEVYVSVAG